MAERRSGGTAAILILVNLFVSAGRLLLCLRECFFINNRFMASFDKILRSFAVVSELLLVSEARSMPLLQQQIASVLFVRKNMSDTVFAPRISP